MIVNLKQTGASGERLVLTNNLIRGTDERVPLLATRLDRMEIILLEEVCIQLFCRIWKSVQC